jgi:predicted ATPase/DNA-binding CsgD family transcriptional regulator
MSASSIPAWIGGFSHREIEILHLISEGLSNREISKQLHLSLDTIKWYNKNLYAKLGVNRRTQALKMARKYRLLGTRPDTQVDEEPRPTNHLPAQLTSYVGRKKEISDITQLLTSSRLVVLTGAGGTGKTRLAIQVAESLSDVYRHGIWLVELASLNDPALLADAIARVLKLPTNSETPLSEIIKRYLSNKQLLLLLDNFEYLVEAAPLVAELLAATHQLTVLATSRERLRLYGEVEYPVSPLSLPDLQQKETTDELLAYEAVDLFIQRARAAKPDFTVDDVNVSAAARICSRLDGLPLAIELAASQVKVFSPSMLAGQLEQSLFSLPRGPRGPRDLPTRQRTLRATIEWGYNLLLEEEKRLFTRLAVFNGGSSLDGIHNVCITEPEENFLDPLTSLVDKNLVYVREDSNGEPRFLMLETIHAYARELLVASGEAEELLKLHAAYFADLAEQYNREIRTPRHVYWNARMQTEKGNLNAAQKWSLTGTEPIFGLRLIAALMDHWLYNSTLEDARWADLALEKIENVPSDLRAAVLRSVGTLFMNLGDMERVGKLHRQAADIFKELGDERNAAWSIIFLSIAYSENPDEIENCLSMAEQSLGIFRREKDKPGIARALNVLGELWRMQGNYKAAKSFYAEGLALSQETGESFRQATFYGNLGFIAYHQNQYQLAVKYVQQSLTIFDELDTPIGGIELSILAGATAALGDPSKAARLIGAADAQMDIIGVDLQPPDRQDVQLIVESIQQTMGKEEYLQAWEDGYAMTTQQVIALALYDMAAGGQFDEPTPPGK